MFDDRPDLQARLAEDVVIWLTTVSPSGQPQPAPVWFVTAEDHFVVYSKDDVPRLRNIEANPKVALHLNSDRDGAGLSIIHGCSWKTSFASVLVAYGVFLILLIINIFTSCNLMELFSVRLF